MAYNLRLNDAKDTKLVPATRPRRKDIVGIQQYINETYRTPIILDPRGNYTTIKIPRSVSKNITIPNLKRALTKAGCNISQLNIAFGDGSGKTKGGMDSTETQFQENATLEFCKQMIEKNKKPTFETIKRIYKKVDDDWMASFEVTAQALKDYVKRGGYEYSRDTGVMPVIEKLAYRYCGVSKKDAWNPMDIVLIRSSKKFKIMKELNEVKKFMDKDAALDYLNSKMRYYAHDKDLLGVSLKKINPKKKIKTEWSDPRIIRQQESPTIKVAQSGINFDWTLQSNGEFKTGELSFQLDINGNLVTMQKRAFSGGVREKNQIDMTSKGASAKLGKVSGPLAVDPFLKLYSMSRFDMKNMPRMGSFTQNEIDYWVHLYKKVYLKKIDRQNINFGPVKNPTIFKNTLTAAIELEQDIARTASQLSSKLQSLYFLNLLVQIDEKGGIKDFFEVMYYGAKKQYESAGVFLKISD